MRAGRKSAAGIIYAIGGAERRWRPRGRPGPSLKGYEPFAAPVSFHFRRSLIAFRVRFYFFLKFYFHFCYRGSCRWRFLSRIKRTLLRSLDARNLASRCRRHASLCARRENCIRCCWIYKIPIGPTLPVFSKAFRLLRYSWDTWELIGLFVGLFFCK